MLKNPWVIIGVIVVVLLGGAILFSDADSEENNMGVEVLSHIKGNTESAVQLVEYSDLQCPACASFQPVLEELMNQYGEDMSLEYKHFPLPMHPLAASAALAVEAAGQQGKFFEYHDLLFINQQEWSGVAVPTNFYVKYATELDLDIDQFRRQMKSSILRDKIQAEQKEGRALNITGTPTFFLNGEKMEFDTFEAFIAQVALAINPDLSPVSESAEGSDVRFGF